MRRQLGLDLPASSLVRALPDPATGVPQWQLASLVRKMARVRMASAATTLRTLKTLIEDIPNMVIRDEIASQVCCQGGGCRMYVVGRCLCLVDRLRVGWLTSLGGVPREQKNLKGHLPRVIYHQVY